MMKFALCVLFCALTFHGTSQDLSSLVDQVDSSVFKIITYNDWGFPNGSGTGFYTSGDGKAMTNWHVLEESAYAFVLEIDGSLLPIQHVLGGCEECDLVEFQVGLPDEADRTPLEFATDPVRKGQELFIVGC